MEEATLKIQPFRIVYRGKPKKSADEYVRARQDLFGEKMTEHRHLEENHLK
jgi:hypothetical protein